MLFTRDPKNSDTFFLRKTFEKNSLYILAVTVYGRMASLENRRLPLVGKVYPEQS
jgi:hypothetical protein